MCNMRRGARRVLHEPLLCARPSWLPAYRDARCRPRSAEIRVTCSVRCILLTHTSDHKLPPPPGRLFCQRGEYAMPAASLVTGYDPYFIRFADEAAMFHVEMRMILLFADESAAIFGRRLVSRDALGRVRKARSERQRVSCSHFCSCCIHLIALSASVETLARKHIRAHTHW